MLKPFSTVVFQGDSVTDCSRSRTDPALLGDGYPSIISQRLAADYPQLGLKLINTGVSGNRAVDLVNRWKEDCIDLQPDVLSILIGVNDTWRRYDSNEPTSDSDYETRLRLIITDAKINTPADILLFVPFVIDVNDGVARMREDLSGKQEVVRKLAAEYSLKCFDLDAMFKKECETCEPTCFTADGVHPNRRGHELIADAWFDVFMK